MKKLLTILAISLMIFFIGGLFFAEEAKAQWSAGLLIESGDFLAEDGFDIESVYPELDLQFKDGGLKFQLIYYSLFGLGSEIEYSASYGDYMSLKHHLDMSIDMSDPFSWKTKYTFEPSLGGFTVITEMWTMEATSEFGFMTEQSDFDLFWDNAKWKNNFSFALPEPMSFGAMIGAKYSPSKLGGQIEDNQLGSDAMDLIIEIDFGYAISDALSIKFDMDPTYHLFEGYMWDDPDTTETDLTYQSDFIGTLDIAFELTLCGDLLDMISYELELKPSLSGILGDDGIGFSFAADLSIRLDLDALLGTEEEEGE